MAILIDASILIEAEWERLELEPHVAQRVDLIHFAVLWRHSPALHFHTVQIETSNFQDLEKLEERASAKD